MRATFGFICIAALMLAVGHWFGPVEVTRLLGVIFVCAGAYACFAQSFAISFGQVEVARLTGWRKLLAAVPVSMLGLAVAIYAPQLTCLSYKYRHLCA